MVFYLFALFHVTDTSRALVWRMSLNQKGLLLQKAAFCFSSSSSTLHCKNRPQKLVEAFLNGALSDLKEDNSSPRITLSEGPNTIGRGNVSITDKRLSRKHITITTSTSGSASLSVERTLWVVRSSGERKKVNPRGEVSLANDDLIELIPGHQLVLPGSHERSAKKARKEGDDSDDVEAIPKEEEEREREMIVEEVSLPIGRRGESYHLQRVYRKLESSVSLFEFCTF
ncbi:hypothetical protein Bca4012_000969 [Brassica carinata]